MTNVGVGHVVTVANVIRYAPRQVGTILSLIIRHYPIFRIHRGRHVQSGARLSRAVHRIITLVPTTTKIIRDHVVVGHGLRPYLGNVSSLI